VGGEQGHQGSFYGLTEAFKPADLQDLSRNCSSVGLESAGALLELTVALAHAENTCSVVKLVIHLLSFPWLCSTEYWRCHLPGFTLIQKWQELSSD
jgi:hypothetical protein